MNPSPLACFSARVLNCVITGIETTESDICASMEIHINADISLAILQYWRANGKYALLKRRGFAEIALGIADFWISRVTLNKTSKKYEILGKTVELFYSDVLLQCYSSTNSSAC